MQKVIVVNLSGNAYQVEERGYDALMAYLASAETALAGNPDKAEIVADLEQAIGEKCRSFLGPNKTVVVSGEIDQILAEMGPVDTGAAPEAQGAAGAHEDKTEQKAGAETGAAKRLYQLREGAMLSGVCNGLAAYLNVDVGLLRVAFVILAVLTKGVWILVYAVLSFVIPYAETSEERAAAHGQRPLTAKDLIDDAKSKYAGFKTNKEWKKHWRYQRRQLRQQVRQSIWAHRWAPDLGVHPTYAAQVWGGLTSPLFGLINLALLLLLVLSLVSISSTQELFGYPLPAGVPFWAWMLILLAVYEAIASPFKFARRAALFPYGPPPHAMVFQPFIGLIWAAAVFFSLWWGYHHQPEVQDFIRRVPDIWNHLVESNR